jgi:hypothetical protein
MKRTPSRWLATTGLIAACVVHNSAAVGQTPEQEKMWEAQRVQKQADDKARAEMITKQREGRRADPMAWVHTLDPMAAGGWTFRSVGADGSWAIFSTEHQLKRSRHLTTAWLRQEYAEPQRSPAGDVYSSDVQKVQYDCVKEQARVLLAVYYAQNNLSGSQQSEESDPKEAPWDAIIPGTQSEITFHWACGPGSARSRPG